MIPSRQALSTIFSSLCRDSRPWSLTRTLQSENPTDIQGQLCGTATFTPLRRSANVDSDLVYREEGDMPNTFGIGATMPSLRWSKKYIWRLSEGGKISVWFPTVAAEEGTDEVDYLFHEFDFDDASSETDQQPGKPFVTPPQPPLVPDPTTVLTARGSHLCINDMYRTAYAFRIHQGTGEVVSWSSRHVVKGPKKDQDIVNLYRLQE